MEAANPYVVWVVIIVGTAAFWVVIFLTVRGLFDGPEVDDAPEVEAEEDPARAREQLARGEITVEEYMSRSVQEHIATGTEHSSDPRL